MSTRRGTMILELVVAFTLLGTLLIVCLEMFSAAAAQRRAADERTCALVELGNVMERVAARPWPELTTSAVARERLSPWAAGQLPGAELKIEVSTPSAEPGAKQITASLRWEDRSRRLVAPLRLTTWKYRSPNQ
jgi:hypothetical protein